MPMISPRAAAAAVPALAFSLAAGLAALTPTPAAAAECDVDRPVVFAGLDWDSNSFHVAVAGFILEHGYGCRVDSIPGSTIPLLNGMARGDIDITMEMWIPNVKDAWEQAVARGQVVEVGTAFPDATQKWYVPKYIVEGENAPAAGLKSVADLPQYAEVFSDPEEPGKGRFYNCILGWSCEVINTKKLHAYGLLDHYTNFRPGTGAALSSAIESAILREEPILFYYWGPTWVLGKIGDEVVALEEPPFDQAVWDTLTETANPENVEEATEYPLVEVSIALNKDFHDEAPTISAFLSEYSTTNALVSEALAYMQDNDASADEAAEWFLKEHPDLWAGWVPEEVAEKVKAALGTS